MSAKTPRHGRVDYPKGGHGYYLDDVRCVGVTTIIGAMPKFLENYHQEQVAKAAVSLRHSGLDDDAFYSAIRRAATEDRDRAADLGTRVHGFIQAEIAGTLDLDTVDDDAWPYVEAAILWIATYEPVFHHVEVIVGSRKHRYMGTLDWIAEVPGHGLVLGDWKSSRSGLWGKSLAAQLSLYRFSEFMLIDGKEQPMPTFDTCMGVCLRGADGVVTVQSAIVQADEWIFGETVDALRRVYDLDKRKGEDFLNFLPELTVTVEELIKEHAPPVNIALMVD